MPMNSLLVTIFVVALLQLLQRSASLTSPSSSSFSSAPIVGTTRTFQMMMSSNNNNNINTINNNAHQLQSCPEGPPSQWESQLDTASKAFLAPIVFNGKLISLSEDYGGRIAATFRVQKQIKNIGSTSGTVPVNLLPGTQVTLYFVRNKAWRWIPPYCAVYLNETLLSNLRPEGKYLVFAAAPLNSLVDLHRQHQHQTIGGGGGGQSSANSNYDSRTSLLASPSSSSSSLSSSSSSLPSSLPLSSLSSLSSSSSSSSLSSSATLFSTTASATSSTTHHLRHSHSTTSSSSTTNLYINYLSAFAPPVAHNKRSSRAVRKILCPRCAKPPQVKGLNGDLRVASRGRLRLRCKVTGNPFPWIDWFRNGKRLKNKGRISIKNKKRVSRLEIRRVHPSTDTGYYECRAMNVVAREPSVGRARVIVTSMAPISTWNNSHNNNHNPYNSRRNVNKTSVAKASPTVASATSTKLWPMKGRPCPLSNFCLHGGTCTLYEAVGEYVCQCAEGFRGQRCENKDIYALVASAQKATSDYGVTSRMFHLYWMKNARTNKE